MLVFRHALVCVHLGGECTERAKDETGLPIHPHTDSMKPSIKRIEKLLRARGWEWLFLGSKCIMRCHITDSRANDRSCCAKSIHFLTYTVHWLLSHLKVNVSILLTSNDCWCWKFIYFWWVIWSWIVFEKKYCYVQYKYNIQIENQYLINFTINYSNEL